MGRGSDEVLRDLLGLQETLYRLFDEHPSREQPAREAVPTPWSPAVDIYETDESFVLTAELPGMDQNDMHLEITEDRLVLRGERPLHTGAPAVSYHRVERPNGIFQRTFRLPTVVDPRTVSAAYHDGVLRVTLPKRVGGRAFDVRVE
ncbi:MAG: Hsp20/alpha crystallin family protein [Proteobacteria bacterium]|nr:Hsp20/alpha crystallin family protein [Pseudomonadota bacterium]